MSYRNVERMELYRESCRVLGGVAADVKSWIIPPS